MAAGTVAAGTVAAGIVAAGIATLGTAASGIAALVAAASDQRVVLVWGQGRQHPVAPENIDRVAACCPSRLFCRNQDRLPADIGSLPHNNCNCNS